MIDTEQPPARRWHDGDTSLLFGLFGVVVFALLLVRIAEPGNWIPVAAGQVDGRAVDGCRRTSG